MNHDDATALLDAHLEALGVHDSAVGPVLVMKPFSVSTRATPARVYRVRLHTDRVDGPHWLTLLAQCAWLRGGIIGERVVPQSTP